MLIRAVFSATYQPIAWIVIGAIAVATGLLAISGNSEIITFFIVWVVAMALILGMRYARTRSVLLGAYPVGKVMRSGFGADHFVLANGDDSSRMAYSGFDRAERRGDLVWARRMALPRRVVYPGALFSDADLARLGTSSLSSAGSPRPRPGTRA